MKCQANDKTRTMTICLKGYAAWYHYNSPPYVLQACKLYSNYSTCSWWCRQLMTSLSFICLILNLILDTHKFNKFKQHDATMFFSSFPSKEEEVVKNMERNSLMNQQMTASAILCTSWFDQRPITVTCVTYVCCTNHFDNEWNCQYQRRDRCDNDVRYWIGAKLQRNNLHILKLTEFLLTSTKQLITVSIKRNERDREQ